MLSTDLRHMKVWFDATRDGCEMTYEGAAAFSRELDAAIQKAEALEQYGVPLEAFASGGGPVTYGFDLDPRRSAVPRGDNVISFRKR